MLRFYISVVWYIFFGGFFRNDEKVNGKKSLNIDQNMKLLLMSQNDAISWVIFQK